MNSGAWAGAGASGAVWGAPMGSRDSDRAPGRRVSAGSNGCVPSDDGLGFGTGPGPSAGTDTHEGSDTDGGWDSSQALADGKHSGCVASSPCFSATRACTGKEGRQGGSRYGGWRDGRSWVKAHGEGGRWKEWGRAEGGRERGSEGARGGGGQEAGRREWGGEGKWERRMDGCRGPGGEVWDTGDRGHKKVGIREQHRAPTRTELRRRGRHGE